MLEIIKALIEIATRLVGAGDRLRGNQFKAVGQKLLALYFRVNETIEGAQKVILAMQVYRRDTEWRQEHGKATIYTGTTHHFGASYALEEQSLNIRRLADALGKVRVELSLVDANLQRRLDGLVAGKGNAIVHICMLLRKSRIPLRSISAEELNAAIEENERQHGFFHDYGRIIVGDRNELITERFGSELLYRQISAYLDSGIPQKNIDELITLASNMREQIGKHWSLAETLPEAARLIRKHE